ncbi:uncharacterized protein LOC124886703 [Capsicum annuum]|uniref:uncharacterized protein LOC124886703 n=1 Tax=Capsicum annuum TaxID=4072 RepID=UPI001FB16C4B|nr:uncharacterized protein LOC124886703 [Capsicum annuum]
MGEVTTGRGLNQQLGLSRACDNRWGSHYKSFSNFILMFGSILDVLESLVLNARNMDERAKAMGHLEACWTFEVAFMLHLMRDILAITNELNKCLQKRSKTLQMLCYLLNYTVLHHYRVEVFCNIIDWQLQELNDRFDEVSTNLLHGITCLNQINSFLSFDIKKIIRMGELYSDDFDESNMGTLENQLASYIIDVRDVDERFSDLNGLCELSKRLV